MSSASHVSPYKDGGSAVALRFQSCIDLHTSMRIGCPLRDGVTGFENAIDRTLQLPRGGKCLDELRDNFLLIMFDHIGLDGLLAPHLPRPVRDVLCQQPPDGIGWLDRRSDQ